MSKHTPGPWIWRINKATKHIRLVGRGLTVMDFWRYGMRSASPRFRDQKDLMVRADELSVIIPGEEHHADWNQDIKHPDARLIAAAPDLLEACKIILDGYDNPESDEYFDWPDAAEKLRAAIDKAEGRDNG